MERKRRKNLEKLVKKIKKRKSKHSTEVWGWGTSVGVGVRGLAARDDGPLVGVRGRSGRQHPVGTAEKVGQEARRHCQLRRTEG